ncbi:hypothetical protein [Dictyobacter formicarum]|uniref:Uncharacterized protein n=1 Tax=Dictyobacter formicarum TaxID=2778368 RepID=A0ABQ3VLW5_9CHLR|nr:hypothetical protein [Dictyobacter formicarum]GHO86679.1 hypothetical protein KSZ_46850 [Dictyobacter formicarum]
MSPESSGLVTEPQVSRKAVKKINLPLPYGLSALFLLALCGGLYTFCDVLLRHWGDIGYFNGAIFPVFFNIVQVVFFTIVVISSTVKLSDLQRKRQDTLLDGSVNLAAAQPRVVDGFLPHLLIIDQRISWAYYIRGAGYYLAIGIAIYGFSFLMEYMLWKHMDVDLFICVSGAGALLFILFIWSLTAKSRAYEQLVAMEHGLLKRTKQRELFIPWHEVRLFAIDNTAIMDWKTNLLPFMRSDIPTYYELSSEQVILQWRWLRPPRWYELSIAEPALGYEIYNQQMQVLLSIIVVKTGQPLYDLR